MKVLVTGGTGVVGRAAVTALVERGHEVRLLSRNAARDAAQWDESVEPWVGDVGRDKGVAGSAEGCDAILHVVGIIADTDGATVHQVNVEGTRHIVREAERAGAPTLVFVSSLGADRGTSDYHRSKRDAEAIVRGYSGEWVIVRPGNVYGPGDDEISLLLRMVRTLPVIPVIGGGDVKFQPVYAGDLGIALAIAVERGDLAQRTLEIAGTEETSQNDLLDRFARITGRQPARVGVPEFLTSFGISIAESAGLPVPFHEAQLTMLREGNRIPADRVNALTDVLDITPTPLEEGLRILADGLPEALPSEGFGALKRKRYWADIAGSAHTPETLLAMFRERFSELMPDYVTTDAEPDTPDHLEEGVTLTMSLPLRGNIQVRVEEATPRRITLCTLEGHPLTGAVRFLAEERGDRVRFEVQVYDRPATLIDHLMMRPLGEMLQASTWEQLVERVIDMSAGRAANRVEHDEEVLDDRQAELIDEWLRDLIMTQRRQAAAPPGEAADVSAEIPISERTARELRPEA